MAQHYNTDTIRQVAGFTKEGVTLLGISEAAEKDRFQKYGGKIIVPATYKGCPAALYITLEPKSLCCSAANTQQEKGSEVYPHCRP